MTSCLSHSFTPSLPHSFTPSPQTTNYMEPPISAVAFDMDGLMFNTENVYFQAGCRLMERRGHVFTKELSDAVTGAAPQRSF